MNQQYLAILIFIVLGILWGIVPMLLARFLGPKRPNQIKNSPYECGFEPFGNARMKFDVRFYLVAILFIVFDLELVFLFPFAVVFRNLPVLTLAVMGVFLGLLMIGFLYEWKKGALEWE